MPPPCRCGIRNPASGQSDQAQSGSDRGRPRNGLHEDPEHLQDHWNQVQAQRAIWRDNRWRQENEGQCCPVRAQLCWGSLVSAGGNRLSLFCCPTDRGNSGERQTCAETDLGWQRNEYRERDLWWEIDSGKKYVPFCRYHDLNKLMQKRKSAQITGRIN